MKKVLLLFGILSFFLTGCGRKSYTEDLTMKCQKAKDYEFYNSMHVIGVYSTEEGETTKIEVVENFTPKWEDVNTDTLRTDLEMQKTTFQKKYEKLEFLIDSYKNNITSSYVIPITEKNIKQMKKEDDYKSAIKGDLFSVADYWSYLEQNGYVCE